jgi:hypothetical protein
VGQNCGGYWQSAGERQVAGSGGAASENANWWLPCVDSDSEGYFMSIKLCDLVELTEFRHSAGGSASIAIKEVLGLS